MALTVCNLFGSKRHCDHDWAWIRLAPADDQTSGHHWLLERRNPHGGELAFYRCGHHGR